MAGRSASRKTALTRSRPHRHIKDTADIRDKLKDLDGQMQVPRGVCVGGDCGNPHIAHPRRSI